MNRNMKTGAVRAVAAGARRRAMRAIAGSVLAIGAASLGAAVAAPAWAADAPQAVTRVAMLVQLRGPNLKVDERISQHLGERGYAVRLIDESSTPDAARDADLVVISSTVSSKNVRPGWRTLDKPLVTWENDLLDDFAMTGKRHDVDFGETGRSATCGSSMRRTRSRPGCRPVRPTCTASRRR